MPAGPPPFYRLTGLGWYEGLRLMGQLDAVRGSADTSFCRTTILLLFVPFWLFVTPQQLAVFVNVLRVHENEPRVRAPPQHLQG